MKIGELAKKSGLTASRIRFYESSGLLRTASRQANGYRDYSPDALVVLHIITSAQQAGFSLDEIRNLVPADLSQWQHDELIGALQRKVQDIEAMQARLARSKAQLIEILADIEAKPDDVDCASNARRVLAQVLPVEMKAVAEAATRPKPSQQGRNLRSRRLG
ncbi:MerR family transcriptional regulator [Solimonas soli]|uniref:MerR family transcriptional regulator n=1 Tax=Solimonas soli TaxID=413479 RepID=UPI0009FE2D6D|nr:MerR family transcriptional regulator [Solimonas soli]